MKLKIGILSLDVSSASTGWNYSTGKDIIVAYGIIKTDPKLDISERLVIFKDQLVKVLKKYKPTHVVIENGFSGRNVKTLKVLTKFAGVAQECVRRELKVIPYIMNNKTVKAYFKVKTKEELYDLIMRVFLSKKKDEFSFETHNDIVDATAQSMCYYYTVIFKESDQSDNKKGSGDNKKRKGNKA